LLNTSWQQKQHQRRRQLQQYNRQQGQPLIDYVNMLMKQALAMMVWMRLSVQQSQTVPQTPSTPSALAAVVTAAVDAAAEKAVMTEVSGTGVGAVPQVMPRAAEAVAAAAASSHQGKEAGIPVAAAAAASR
jgi:hypothetical protein